MRNLPSKLCLECKKPLTGARWRSKIYCTNKCHIARRLRIYIERWLEGKESGSTRHTASTIVRNFLIRKQKGAAQIVEERLGVVSPSRWKQNMPTGTGETIPRKTFE